MGKPKGSGLPMSWKKETWLVSTSKLLEGECWWDCVAWHTKHSLWKIFKMVNVSVGLLQIITVVWVFHHFHPLKAFGYQSVDNPYSLTKYFWTDVPQASAFVGCFLGFGISEPPRGRQWCHHGFSVESSAGADMKFHYIWGQLFGGQVSNFCRLEL